MAALPLSLLCAGRAEAVSTITQSFSTTSFGAFSNLAYAFTPNPRITSSVNNVNFNKFDSSLGTLLKVRFSGNGDLLGKFRGARNSTLTTGGGASALGDGKATLRLNFSEANWDTLNSGGETQFVSSSALSQVANPQNVKSQGTLLTSSDPTLILSNETTDEDYLEHFRGGLGDNIVATFSWILRLTSTRVSGTGNCVTSATTTNNSNKCTAFDFSPTGIPASEHLSGDINDFELTYEYEPFAQVVPAPLPILGAGMAFAYTRRLRRRIQKARITL